MENLVSCFEVKTYPVLLRESSFYLIIKIKKIVKRLKVPTIVLVKDHELRFFFFFSFQA